MPDAKYNKFFGGKAGSAKKAKTAMRKKYGDDSTFYATVNKKKSQKKAMR